MIAQINITVYILYLPLILLILYVAVSGFCLMLSALNVYVRDLEHIVNIVTMAWFYATPIVYPFDMLPQWLQNILVFNPMTPVILSFRDILYYGTAPNLQHLLIAGCEAVVIFTAGVYIFNALEKGFAEEI